MVDQLRQVDVEGHHWNADLPALQDFGMHFSYNAHAFTRQHNLSSPAFKKGRMRHRLEGIFLPQMIEQDIETGMDLRKVSGRMCDHRAEDSFRPRTEFVTGIRNRHIPGFK